jgi:hypothetical protein
MRNVRQHRLNSIADGVLPIRDDPTDGNVNHLLYLAKQACEIRFTGTSQASSEEHFPRETVTQNPEDLMTNVWL